MMRHFGWLGLLLVSTLAVARPSPFSPIMNADPAPEQRPEASTLNAIEPVAAELQESVPVDLQPELAHAWVILHHAQAAQIKAFLAQDPFLLSAQGVALIDARTNRILLRETPQRLAAIAAIIAELDAPLQQIQLEARIVVARSNQALEWGLRWGFGGGADAALLQNLADQRIAQQGFQPLPMGTERLAVVSAQGAIQAGVRGVIPRLDRAFDLQLSALEQQGYAEIVSQPRLLTADGHEAVIASGTTLSFPGAEGGTTFVDAVLSMRATPKITADGRIMLQLEVAQDSPAGGSSGTINTNSLKTQVLINNGETLVLGGVYRFEDVEEVSKVPVLGDLPLLGGLFRQTRQATLKNELLIFLTPQILP